MPDYGISVRRFGRVDGKTIQELTRALREQGVCARPQEEEDGDAPCLILFSEVGAELCDHVRALSPDGFRRVLAVAVGDPASADPGAWDLLRAGASDVMTWDIRKGTRDLAGVVAARLKRWSAVDELVSSPVVRENLIGRSRAWVSVLREIVEVARFASTSVLITGESGTGKELVARLIHTLDARPNKGDLVLLDCTTVVPELSGSEFFGHERGAFTGSVATRDGAFALADRGTLFLDEVGELPLRLQAELLRVVQEGTYKPVGSNAWRRASFRLICATNRNLDAERARGSFRSDFYHRLASWTCRLPSLEERRDDIPRLVEHFLKQALGTAAPLDPALLAHLKSRPYPGNIRELRQLVTRIAHCYAGEGPISIGSLPKDEWPAAAPESPRQDADFESVIRSALSKGKGIEDIRRIASETAWRIVLAEEGGGTARASQRLGISRRAVQARKKKSGNSPEANGASSVPGNG